MKIKDLKVGDKLWVQYGDEIFKAKYLGNNGAMIIGFFSLMKGTFVRLEGTYRWWTKI